MASSGHLGLVVPEGIDPTLAARIRFSEELERTMLNQTQSFETDDRPLATLARAAAAGDRQAFGELATRCRPAVYATAMQRLGNHAEAEELVQDVFAKAMEKLYQLQAPEAIIAWLRAITARMAINRRLRKAPLIITEPESLEATCADRQTPLEAAMASEREQQVRAGLKRLRPLDRETLTAFYFQGRSLVEMSDEFDSPVGTIKRRLHVARKRLAEELDTLAI